jgi:tRNA threonylcarbamoyl adenosine modification protein YeaZ
VLVLALDTATPASTAALVEVTADGIVGVAERRTVDPRAHGEKLAPTIAAILSGAGVRPGELAAIVAGLGPGPFTGLRVGLATAASMGQALSVPTYGVCSLDGLGRAAGPGRVLVATDARRREIYYASYVDGVRVGGPGVDKPAEVAARIARAAPGPGGSAEAARIHVERAAGIHVERAAGEAAGIHVERAAWEAARIHVERAVGEGALTYGELLGVPVEADLLYPPGAALVALAAERIREAAPSEVLTPLYLRRPDAVEPGGRKPVLTP